MPDIFDEISPDQSPGGDIFDQVAPEAAIGKGQSLANSLRRGIKYAQAIPEAVEVVGVAGMGNPSIRQERAAYVEAMSDPMYQQKLIEAGNNPAKLRQVETTRGPAGRLDVAMTPQRSLQRETVRDFAQTQANIEAIPRSPAQQRLGMAKTTAEKWAAWRKDPVELTFGIVLESLPPSVAGATAGTLVAGPGVGTAIGAGGSSGLMTLASEFLANANQQGVDITNPDALDAFLNNQAAFDAAFKPAVAKAAIVGGVDAGTAGIAGRWIEPALKLGLKQRVIATGKELALQSAGGAGGEAAGQVVAGQELDPFDIAMEALAEVATAPGEAAGNIMAKRQAQTTPPPQREARPPQREARPPQRGEGPPPGAIFDQVASEAQPQKPETASNSRPPGTVATPAPAGASPGDALEQEIAGNVVPRQVKRVDDATGKAIEDKTPATKADLKALAEFIEKGGPNPFATKPSGQPDAQGKPPQTITGSNVQTGTEMPVSPQPAAVGGQAAGGATKPFVPLTDEDLKPDARKDLRAEGVTPENIEALLSGKKTPQQVVDDQLGFNTPNADYPDTMIVLENDDGSRSVGFAPAAGPASTVPVNIGQMGHGDAIRMAREQGIDRINHILRTSPKPAQKRSSPVTHEPSSPVTPKLSFRERKQVERELNALDERLRQADYSPSSIPNTIEAKRAALETIKQSETKPDVFDQVAPEPSAISPQSVPNPALDKPAKVKKAKSNLMNQPPPGGWTDADKVPEQFRKPKSTGQTPVQTVDPAFRKVGTAGVLKDRNTSGTNPAYKSSLPVPPIPAVLYHGTDNPEGQFQRFRDFSHFGTEKTAKARASDKQSRKVIAAKLNIKKPLRIVDPGQDEALPRSLEAVGHTWQSFHKAGYDSLVYLNRYEGISAEDNQRVFDYVKSSGRSMWELTDEEFLKLAPSADDSWLVASGNSVQRLDAEGNTPKPDSAQQNQGNADAEPAITVTPQAGSDAKLAEIRAKREEIKARLRAKLGQVNVGVDPEVATIAAELAVNYTQEGMVRFGDFARAVKAELPDIWDALRQYLRGAWTTAADMNDGIEEVTREQAKAVFDSIDKPAPAEPAKPAQTISQQLSDIGLNGGDAIAVEQGKMSPLQAVQKYFDQGDAVGQFEQLSPAQQEIEFNDMVRRIQLILEGVSETIDKPAAEAESKPQASNETTPGLSPRPEAAANQPEPAGNEPDGPAPDGNRGDVAGSVPAPDGNAKGGRRPRTGGKRAGSPSVAGGAPDAGGILGSTAAGGTGTNPAQPGDGGSVSEPSHVVGRANYWLKDPAAIVGGGPKARFAKNQKAIETVQRLIADGHQPTEADQDALAAYTGWGAFGQELFNGSWEHPAPKPSWEKEDAWLREHLGEADWKSAQESIINAHYTDPVTVTSIWRMIQRMGFTGGRVLEPSIGIGNFFSLMPREVMRNSVLTGIELDQLTARIAMMLHPQAAISVKGYQDSMTADNFYDLILGNWPFSNGKPADRRYNHMGPVLHDYFFLKALDQVRPGGLVVGITSTGTMDKASPTVRRYLAARGELIAAFRLPAGTFGDYAGTKVITDIIILRKRETKLENPTDDWIDTQEVETKDGKFRVNKYYRVNPAQVIGTLGFGHGTTKGRPGMMVLPPPNHQAVIEGLAERVPADVFKPWQRPEGKVKHIQGVPANARQFAVIEKDGDLYQVQGEQLALLHDLKKWKLKGVKDTAKRLAEARAAIAIRDQYDAMMDAYRQGGDFEAARKAMAESYAAFRKAHGSVRNSTMIEVMERAGDSGITSVLNLEDESGRGRDILKKNILRKKVPTGAGSIEDAYAIQRNRSVHFSVAEVAKISKRSEAEVIARLQELNQIFQAPDGTWQARDEYLSDNVRRKLREAEAAQEQGLDMTRNIEALRKIQPKDTPYFEIEVRMGANWVAHDDYKNFVVHLIKTTPDKVDVQRQATGWRVKVNDHNATSSPEALTMWGINHRGTPFISLLNAAMNGTSVVVRVEDQDGNKVPDKQLTEQANGKIDAIREEFQKWIWQDAERIARLSSEYNEANNSMVAPDRDGSHLMLEGLALTMGTSEFDFRQHQKDAVWRGVQDGKAMFGHEVGTGKTFTMAGLAMEGRRLGVFRKPLIFAHNANHSTVIADFRKAYPAGKFLHLDSLSPEERAAKLKQIVLDDWDAVVVPHSLIDRFTLREETLNELAAKEIQALEDELLAEIADAGQDVPPREILDDPKEFAKWAAYKEGLTTAKELVKARSRIKERIRKKAQESSKEGAVFFEDLGVDAIFVDEAHIFKKIALATRKAVKGLNKTESGVGFSLSLLTDYVKSRNSGKGTFLFTGTPITNTLNEAYNMMKYVMSSDMQEARIERFDDWFNVFADSATEVEMNDAGIYEAIERLRAFINVPELARMAGRFFDIVLAKDMPEFKPRSSDDGMTENPVGRPRKQIVPMILEMSDLQKAHLEGIRARYRRWMMADGKTRRAIMQEGKDGPLQLSTEASLSALDFRLIDRFAPDWEGSKANLAVSKIAGIYHEHPQTTQMVFMEQGFNDFTDRQKKQRDGSGNVLTDADGKPVTIKERVIKFNVLRDMVEKLNAKGIPPEQIAIFANLKLDPIATRPDDILRRCVRVTGAVTKEDISALMRQGLVRVAFGQTETMGTGVNAQDYMRAMHHLDAPWMPGALEQRNGRGWRQGNKWNTVLEHRYTVEGSGDGKRWQVLLNKVRFIARFIELLNGDGKGERSLEGDAADAADEEDSVSSFESTFSAAAGDPRQMLRVGLEKKLRQLEVKESNHISATWQAGRKVDELKSTIAKNQVAIEKVRQDLDAYRAQIAGKNFEFELEGQTYTDRDAAEGAIKALPLQTKITEVGGRGPFRLFVYQGFTQYLEGPSGNRYDMGQRSIASAEAMMRGLAARLEKLESETPKMQASIAGLQAMADTPFTGGEKLAATRKALEQISAEIQNSPFPVPSWIRTTAPQGSLFYLKGPDGKLAAHEVSAHRWDANGWWVLYQDATDQLRPVDYSQVLDETGKPIFEERPFIKPPDSATPAVAAAEPTQADMSYAGGEMPRETSSFSEWLDKWIAATDANSSQVMEGVTSAPVWITKGAINGLLRTIRAGYRAGMSLANAIEEGITWLKNQNLEGFQAEEARAWLTQNLDESHFEDAPAPSSDYRVLQQQYAAAEEELKQAISQHMNPPAGMKKAEARNLKNQATAKLRNIRHDLLRNPAYAEHLITRERQVWQQLKALLEPTGIKPSPDGLLGREDRIREVLSDVEVRRVVELDREWEQVRQEIELIPKKLVGAISARLYPAKGTTKTDLELPSEWLQSQLGSQSPVTEPQDITTTADRVRNTVAELPDAFRDTWRASGKTVKALWAKAQTMANRDIVSATKDAADNKAQILSRQAANVVLHEMNRAFGVPIDTRNPQREAALTFAIEAGDKNTLDLMRETILTSEHARTQWARQALTAIAYAEKHWDRFENVVTLYNRVTNAQAAAEQGSGIKTLMRDGGYVFHLQDVLENWAHMDMTGGTGGAATPFKNIRDYATYADSIANGLNPKTLNAVDLLQRRISLGQKLINYRGWQESLKAIIDPATNQPLGADVVVRVRADGSETETAPVGYKLVRFAGQPYAIHRAYSGLFSALTADSGWRQGAGWHTLMKAATTAKHTMLMFDTFHLGRLAFWSAVTRGAGDGVKTLFPGNPASYRQGLTLLDSTIADLRKMAAAGELTEAQAKTLIESKATLMKLLNAGLNVGSVGDNIYADWVQKLPLVGQFNRWLFEKYQRGAMTEVALIEFGRVQRANPELSGDEVARKVAKAVNIRFGNLNSQAWIKSRHAQDLARLVFLAPQWNESLIRSEIEALKDVGVFVKNLPQRKLKVGTLGRAVATAFIGQFIANQFINWFFRDKPTWENEEEGFEAKLSAYVPDYLGNSNGYFLNPMTLPAEITHLILKGHARTGRWDQALVDAIKSRFSSFGRFADVFIEGKNGVGERATGLGDRLALAATDSAPFPIGANAPSRMIASKIAGESKEQYPGQFQRQVMQTFGIKPDSVPSPEQRMRRLAREYNTAAGVVDRGEFGKSDYADLDNAVRVGNWSKARAELKMLLENHDAEAIKRRYELRVVGRFTGSAERETKFLRTLTAEQRKQYDEAMKERRRIKVAVDKLLTEASAKVRK